MKNECFIITESMSNPGAIRFTVPDHVRDRLEAQARRDGLSWRDEAIIILCEELEAKILPQ